MSNQEVAMESSLLQSRDQKVVLTASMTSAKLGVGHQTMAAAKCNSWWCKKMPSIELLLWNPNPVHGIYIIEFVPRTRACKGFWELISERACRLYHTGKHPRRNLGIEWQFKIFTTNTLSNKVALNSYSYEALWFVSHGQTAQSVTGWQFPMLYEEVCSVI